MLLVNVNRDRRTFSIPGCYASQGSTAGETSSVPVIQRDCDGKP